MPIARSGARLMLVAALVAAMPLCAAAAKLSAAAAVRLGAHGYAWDDAGAGGPVSIVVSRSQQRAYVYRGGELVGVSTVSTGKAGHRTPVGSFTILEKAVHHRSNKYSNAPMPFMQRLTWGGIALHAGYLPGYPASHGCIRLPSGFARKLFAATSLGAFVQVTDGGPALPRIEMVSATPAPRPAPKVELAAAAAAPTPAPPPRVLLAAATPERSPPASWIEQSQDDYVTWGTVATSRGAVR